MPEWETLNHKDWLDQITEYWMDAGADALRSRGQFTVAMDASAECLQACQHLAKIDWPWSATHIIPVRENFVPASHARHCGDAIFKALYPCKAKVLNWETEHLSHEQMVERYAKTLKKEGGEQPKIDLTLISLEGHQTLSELSGDIPEFELTALYEIKGGHLPAMALTPWVLQASRQLVCVSQGLNPAVTDRFDEKSPLYQLTEKIKRTALLHTR